jgi:glycerol-3-phosphate dehydrogenase
LPADLYGELVYAIERESAVKPVDFLIRRTGALFFNIGWVQRWKSGVIEAMADMLGYSEEQCREYEAELERHLANAVTPPEEAAASATAAGTAAAG